MTRLIPLLAGWGLFAYPAFASVGETPLPPLPELTFVRFEPAARPALEAAYKAALEHPEDAAASGRLGMWLQAYEDFQSAEVCFERARRLDPESFQWPYLLGVVQLALGKGEDAIAHLRAALTLDPASSPAGIRLADALLQTGDLPASIEAYQAVLRREPESPLANYGLGRALLEQKDAKAAVGPLEKACSADPEFGSAHYSLALAYRDLGRREDARIHLELYRLHQNRWPSADDPLIDEIRSLKTGARQFLAEGVRLAEKNLREPAVQEHLKALEADPSLTQAHVNLIRLYGELNQRDKAEEHYRKGLELNPNLAELHYNFGVILSSEARFGEAAELFERTLQINPYHVQAQNNLGFMRENEGKREEALKLYREAVRNDPTYRLARFNLGRVLVAQGDFDAAIAEFSKILTPEDEETPRYMYALAAAYVKAGQLERALHYAENALNRALESGQKELGEKIERDLALLKKALKRP